MTVPDLFMLSYSLHSSGTDGIGSTEVCLLDTDRMACETALLARRDNKVKENTGLGYRAYDEGIIFDRFACQPWRKLVKMTLSLGEEEVEWIFCLCSLSL